MNRRHFLHSSTAAAGSLLLPQWTAAAADLAPYRGFLDARIRLDRVRRLLDSVAGVPAADLADTRLIPGDAVLREFIGGSTIQIPHNE